MKPWQAIVAIALALIAAGERWHEARGLAAEAATHTEELHALAPGRDTYAAAPEPRSRQ